MSTTLLFGLIPVSVASSNTAAAGFPASNVINTQVLKPWKATGVAADFVQLDLGAATAVNGVAINDANMNSVTVLADNVNPPTTNRGTLTLTQDAQGRYKGMLAFAATFRYVKFVIATGTTNDGTSAWRISCAYPFSSTFSLPRDPLFGESELDANTPQSRVDLDNGQVIRDTTGPNFVTLTLQFRGGAADDHEQLQQYARAGLCWLNMNISNAPWQQWPVRHHDPKITRKFTGFNAEEVDITLKEEA